MGPIELSDDEMSAVFAACQPLAPHHRDEFLRALAHELRSQCGELGPGVVYRTIREVQRKYFEPPDLSGAGGISKYR